MANSKTDYPTVQVANGFRGKGVKLETRDTGSFGAMVKMYIAAGNLFIGTFEVGNALTDPRKATNSVSSSINALKRSKDIINLKQEMYIP